MLAQEKDAKRVEDNVTTMPPRVSLKQALAELDNFDGDVPNYKPKVSDYGLFMVLEYEGYESKFQKGQTYQIATLRASDGGFWRLIIGPDALRGAFDRLRPEPGEWFKLKRLPDSTDGNKPQRYRMRVLGREASKATPDFGCKRTDEADNGGTAKAADADDAPATTEDLKEAIPF